MQHTVCDQPPLVVSFQVMFLQWLRSMFGLNKEAVKHSHVCELFDEKIHMKSENTF